MTFSNKLDREGLDSFDLMQNVEDTLKIACAPMTAHRYWPRFSRCLRPQNQTGCFLSAQRGRKTSGILDDVYSSELDDWLGTESADKLREDLELVDVLDPFDAEAYRRVFRHPFSLEARLAILGEGAARPICRLFPGHNRGRPSKGPFIQKRRSSLGSASRFKQPGTSAPRLNGFVRITSGEYKRGMKLKHVRAGKMMTVNNATTFLARDRVVTQQAFPGDIIGIHNHGGIRIGDTFTEGEELKFTGIPAFAPELFRRVQLLDPLKAKSLSRVW